MEGDLAPGLHRVYMKHGPASVGIVLAHNSANIVDRLNRSQFVVDRHH
jgi:hypothetical protein